VWSKTRGEGKRQKINHERTDFLYLGVCVPAKGLTMQARNLDDNKLEGSIEGEDGRAGYAPIHVSVL
jgi:hypothetical protein